MLFRLRCIGHLVAVLALALCVGGPRTVCANGWEHGAVPFEALLEALSFDDAVTRAQAARSLGFRGQREAVPPLLELLADGETDDTVRAAVYTALGSLGDRRATPVLLACVDGTEPAELKGDCLVALGTLGDPASLARVIEAAGDAAGDRPQSRRRCARRFRR